jgi:hypothetical protein
MNILDRDADHVADQIQLVVFGVSDRLLGDTGPTDEPTTVFVDPYLPDVPVGDRARKARARRN